MDRGCCTTNLILSTLTFSQFGGLAILKVVVGLFSKDTCSHDVNDITCIWDGMPLEFLSSKCRYCLSFVSVTSPKAEIWVFVKVMWPCCNDVTSNYRGSLPVLSLSSFICSPSFLIMIDFVVEKTNFVNHVTTR